MDEILSFAADFLSATKSPIAPEVKALIASNDWKGLSTIVVDPSTYANSHSFFTDYVAVSAFKKLKVDSQAADLRKRAKLEWLQNEKHCFVTNSRLYPYLERFGNRDSAIEKFLSLVKKHMVNYLGRGPDHLIAGRFGPGTTMVHRGARCLVPDKLSSIPEMTRNAFPLAGAFLLQEQTWVRSTQNQLFSQSIVPSGTFKLVKGNRWSTVPKDSTKDRSIGVEPTLNLWYQLGIGQVMKQRLQKRGLLLPNGKSEVLHKRLAREGSKTGLLATIDCSSASDTVSSSLVRLVVPPRWLELLEDTRSPFTLVDNRPYRLEKFSSMGNGYTFELETAIFASIACAVAEIMGIPLTSDCFSVYGDDIIVPTAMDALLRKALVFCGFIVNTKKSYATGPFRESCGGDYFLGAPVRPVFFKNPPTCVADWFGWLNRVYSLIEYFPDMQLVWDKYFKAKIPSQYADCMGPPCLGDIVLHSPAERWTTRRMLSSSETKPNDWMAIRALTPHADKISLERWDEQTAVTASIYGCADSIAPRNSLRGYRKSWVAYG